MATFVLVPGLWLGGWAWSEVTPKLQVGGHDVHPVTLTGVGDRVHLGGPDVDLDTHISDVVNTITYADLHDVVLVGHSYGGLPVSAAAGAVRDRLRQVIYVESGPVSDGVAQIDMTAPEEQERTRSAAAEHGDGWRVPFPSWDELGGPDGSIIAGLGEAERARMAGRATPHPLGSITQPMHGSDPTGGGVPHALITCMFPLDQLRTMIESEHPYFAAFGGKEWTYAELPTGHWPMFSEPDRLAEVLQQLAAG